MLEILSEFGFLRSELAQQVVEPGYDPPQVALAAWDTPVNVEDPGSGPGLQFLPSGSEIPDRLCRCRHTQPPRRRPSRVSMSRCRSSLALGPGRRRSFR